MNDQALTFDEAEEIANALLMIIEERNVPDTLLTGYAKVRALVADNASVEYLARHKWLTDPIHRVCPDCYEIYTGSGLSPCSDCKADREYREAHGLDE